MIERILLALALTFTLISDPAYAHGDTDTATTSDKRIALTFDDIPRTPGAFFTPEERTQRLIAALKKAGVVQAAFFINPGNLDKPFGAGGEGRIANYVAAGHVIANHSNDHPHLDQTDADDYLANIDSAEAWLKGRDGYRPWFRFPYLHEGGRDKQKRDEVRAGLEKRGLRNGYVTADGSDWQLESSTIEAVKAGHSMNMIELRRLYLRSQISGIEYHDVLARKTLGRAPAHIMLLHETDLAAMYLVDLVSELRSRGWTIITADEAFADPINTAMPDVPYSSGTLIGSMAWEKDIEPPLSPVWMSSGMIKYVFDTRVLRKSAQQ